jgi:hydroxypyruvate isomerase
VGGPDIVAPHGITLIVEPLNTLVNHSGYYLNHRGEACEIAFKAIRELGFRQLVAMAYIPSKDAMTTLAEVLALARDGAWNRQGRYRAC